MGGSTVFSAVAPFDCGAMITHVVLFSQKGFTRLTLTATTTKFTENNKFYLSRRYLNRILENRPGDNLVAGWGSE